MWCDLFLVVCVIVIVFLGSKCFAEWRVWFYNRVYSIGVRIINLLSYTLGHFSLCIISDCALLVFQRKCWFVSVDKSRKQKSGSNIIWFYDSLLYIRYGNQCDIYIYDSWFQSLGEEYGTTLVFEIQSWILTLPKLLYISICNSHLVNYDGLVYLIW